MTSNDSLAIEITMNRSAKTRFTLVTSAALALTLLEYGYAGEPAGSPERYLGRDRCAGTSLPVGRGSRSTAGEEIRRGLLLPVAGPGGRPGARSTSPRSWPKTRPRSEIRGARCGARSFLRITGASRSSAIIVSDDESVLRKHAQMLADADVDMIVFDVTNQVTYPQSWKALCRVFDRVKREGNRVPQIAFLCPFGDPRESGAGTLGRSLQPQSLL